MNVYEKYVKNILDNGKEEYPRGFKTYSVKNVSIIIPTGITFRRYKDNPLIGFMEGMQFVANTFNLSEIKRIAPNAKIELFGPMSSYGLRVGDQIKWVIDELEHDPYSRRAVLVIADQKENLEDRPCTTSMQFYKHDEYSLNTTVTMRSSDAVYGLPYDFIQFGMMSMTVANCLVLLVNKTTVNILNAHIYENTKELAKDFETWEFSIPTFEKLDDYEKWMLFSMTGLNRNTMLSWFNFRKTYKEYE